MIDALPLLLGPEGYQISRSVRLRSSASAYFSRTLVTPTSNTVWSWSGWVKLGQLTTTRQLFGGAGTNYGAFGIESNDKLTLWTNAGATAAASAGVYRDPAAWYHVVVISNGTTVKGYINNVEVVSYTGTITNINSAIAHQIGRYGGLTYYTDGYLTEINFIDGQALTPSSFGETNTITGVWQPKKYAGTYGTNGFYLNFSDNSAATAAAIGKDYSGNGNNWTPNNISVTAGVTYDSMLDVPTQWADGGNGRGNYATLNPLSKDASGTVLDGNLGFTASAIQSVTSTIAYPSSGKWYCEFQITTTPDNSVFELVGLTTANAASNVTRAYASNGQYYNGSAFVTFGSAWAINDVIGIAADIDNSQVSFYKNGTLQGSTQTFAFPADYAPMMRARNTGTSTFNANFGQRPFAYTPPTGFKALNTLNLPEPTILKGNQYFDAVTRTGTGSSDGVSQVISSLAFTPDLVWNKARSNAFNHNLVDSARGNDAILFSNLTNAETSVGTTGTQLQLTTNGFTAIQRVSYQATNQNGVTYADWCWKEGATQGFDIVTYTGTGSSSTVVSHSLGVKPSMIITKIRSSGSVGWTTTHKSLGTNMSDHYIYLNTTAASATLAGVWGAEPTSTTFGSSVNIHSPTVGATVVAYLFSEVAGFSKFGSYTGNGSANGPFVFCGFRPRWVMIKRSDAAENWYVHDAARNTYNVTDASLEPNLSGAETTAYNVRFDLVANGFKVRTGTGTEINASGGTYIFAAFAENPFKNALAR